MQDKGSKAGSPGASGYAPGHGESDMGSMRSGSGSSRAGPARSPVARHLTKPTSCTESVWADPDPLTAAASTRLVAWLVLSFTGSLNAGTGILLWRQRCRPSVR
ncbi:hypothetical protein MGN01_44890 [Methylobacterium gnaphalii]|uniref:Uncharacterized protein n=1 Tax=Methylobacterium gnaphalii TaxID=1010610 RepID=A0A512JRQ2_9HYPH|nr:hypothetical protein MGN01_44890 [Methylobacterium gnaphalii]GLS49794.1 hypothetical protein GCM10007885_26460 [Methylobacterium gnaphalii]